jgi:signal transduction histidine kinase
VLVEQLAQRTRELQSAEDALAALTVEHERARVARELHDIVAHHLAVVVLHAGAGRLAATVQPERAAARLDAIRTSAEEAIEELGRLVGLAELDHRGDRLPALLDDARSAGLEVTAETPGLDVLLPARVAEDTYRIVREGLTNALKHAPGSAVHVTVRVVADAVRIEIHDSDARRTAARPALSATGSGLGLLGMRERVTAAGGALAAGPDGDGGWSLEASLPISPLAANSAGGRAHEPLAAASADTPPRGPEVRRSG